MGRKDRSLAGFEDVATEQNTNNVNANNNIYVNAGEGNGRSPDTIDKILNKDKEKKENLVLTGIYLQPELAKILDRLGKEGGRGAKSSVVNDALRNLFKEKGLL